MNQIHLSFELSKQNSQDLWQTSNTIHHATLMEESSNILTSNLLMSWL